MNFGLRNRQISSDAVPAIRTRPEVGADHACCPPSVASALADELEPDPARALDEHHVAGLRAARGDQRGRLARVGDAWRLAVESLGDRGGQRPDGDQQRRRRRRAACSPSSRW